MRGLVSEPAAVAAARAVLDDARAGFVAAAGRRRSAEFRRAFDAFVAALRAYEAVRALEHTTATREAAA